MIRRRVVVRGTVQGVSFRASCEREARRHRVAGWVANRADGAVEAVFEGEDADVTALVDWAHQGPRWAAVSSVEVQDEPPQGETGFRVTSSRE